MKIIRIITLIALAIVFSGGLFSQVGIGTITPNASAELDLTSTTKGFLPPRMTQAQRNAIAIPVAAGLIVWCSNCGTSGETQVYNGTTWTNLIGGTASPYVTYCTGSATTILEVINSTTGKIWMDRNLGATQVATSSTDASSYGDLYQWGRRTDGHQCRTSTTTSTNSSTDATEHGDFILESISPFDWRVPQNVNLWQGVSGTNNPCPSGYRIPTYAELEAERTSWGSNNAAGAFASPLKLPLAGYRHYNTGSLGDEGVRGHYWSTAVISADSGFLLFSLNGAFGDNHTRAYGSSVRCLKD